MYSPDPRSARRHVLVTPPPAVRRSTQIGLVTPTHDIRKVHNSWCRMGLRVDNETCSWIPAGFVDRNMTYLDDFDTAVLSLVKSSFGAVI